MERARDLHAIAAGIDQPWQPVDVVTVNDAVIRMAKIHGEFAWHRHDEDELFLCWQGRFILEQVGARDVMLEQGQLYVVPRGVEHRPVASEPALILMIERPETQQYGNR